MTEECARAILRIIAVIVVMVGASLTTTTLVSIVAASNAMQNAAGMTVQVSGMVAEMGGYAILSYLLVAAWGVLLFFWSPKLAAMVVA
jgi:hypothetical protein